MMKVKIDTKEIFHVISIEERELTANMAEELMGLVAKKQELENKSLVFNLEGVVSIDDKIADSFLSMHETCYANHLSMVLCGLSPAIKNKFQEHDLSDNINITPTESEAWDIVQMEEIERELGTE
jgi:anti-anti-sigma regulatory factor